MKIRRMTILGCSLLFAAISCDSDTGGNGGGGKTDTVADTATGDTGGTDVASGDTGGTDDVAQIDTVTPGDTVADTATDTGGPGTDVSGTDVAGPDISGRDIAGEDVSGGPDVVEDVGGEDIQTSDAGQPDVITGVDTTDEDGSTTTVKAGDPCNEEPWTAICDDAKENVELVCMGEKWNTPQQLDLFGCFCDDQDGKTFAVCAVPGFVGIAVAGRSRTVTSRVRLV